MKKVKSAVWFVVASFLVLALAVSLAAQTAGRGSVSGLVMDPSGAIVPNATVELTDTATGVMEQTHSSGAGLYSFISLIPGTYALRVTATGFEAVVQQNILIAVDEPTQLNVTLKVGAASQTVTVTEAPPVLETAPSATTGQIIGSEEIDTVPLVTRNVYQLADLTPGIVVNNGQVDSSSGGVSSAMINGAPMGALYYMEDGVSTTIVGGDDAEDTNAFTQTLGSVQEFQMQTNYVPANEFSGVAGVINVVSKSGTNAFHGNGFFFARPNALNANNYFTKASELAAGKPNVPSAYDRYQWGGSVGGPIKRDKLFFFADYEATNQQSSTTATDTVPTAAEKTGDFSADSFTIYNPNPSTWAAGPTPCKAPATTCPQPFPGNKITSGFDTVAAKYLQYWPAPNYAPSTYPLSAGGGTNAYHSGNFFVSGSNPNKAQSFNARVDYALTQTQHVFARVSFSDTRSGGGLNPFGNLLTTPSTTKGPSGQAMVGYDWALSPITVLQVRGAGTMSHVNQGPAAEDGFDLTTLGYPASLVPDEAIKSIPSVSFSGNGAATTLGSTNETFFFEHMNIYEFDASLSTTRGRHQLSAGWDFQKSQYDGGQPECPSGCYAFNAGPVSSTNAANNGDAFAAFLLGVGSTSQGTNFTTDILQAQESPFYALFIQDNYQIRRNLTLNAGLRWEVYGGATERHNRMEYFNPTATYTSNGVAMTGGDVFAGTGGSGRSPYVTNYNDFAPRIGLSWNPTKNLVARGAFGIFYGPSEHSAMISHYNDDSYLQNSIWAASILDTTGNYAIPENPLDNAFPNGIVLPTDGTLGLATNLGGSISSVLRSQPELTAYNYNLGLEYQFPGQTTLSAAWVASRGLYLQFARFDTNALEDFDKLPLETIEQYQGNLLNQVPYPYEAAITSKTAPWYGHSTVPQWEMLGKYPQFSNGTSPSSGGVEEWGSPAGLSKYNSLQVKVTRHMNRNLQVLSAFTWSKLLTNDSSPADGFDSNSSAAPQDWWDLKAEYSYSYQNMPFAFTFQGTYQLPIGSGQVLKLDGWKNEAFGGWSVSPILTLYDGVPIGTPTGTGALYFHQRPNVVSQNCGAGAPHTTAEWFNYSCLSQPASQYFPGTAQPTLPGVKTDPGKNFDLALSKQFRVTESQHLNVRAGAYNLANTVQFGYPSPIWEVPTSGSVPTAAQMAGFGKITSQENSPRQLSFEADYIF